MIKYSLYAIKSKTLAMLIVRVIFIFTFEYKSLESTENSISNEGNEYYNNLIVDFFL